MISKLLHLELQKPMYENLFYIPFNCLYFSASDGK